MSQQRGTETDQLASVIQVLQLGRKSGMLIAQRGEGGARQEGQVSLMKGHVVRAQCGVLEGQSALIALHSWGNCRFLFLPDSPERATGPLTELSPLLPQGSTDKHRALPVGQEKTVNTGPLPAPGAPRRIQLAEQSLRALEQRGLSRQHRRLLLLIDGQRPPSELARLMGRGPNEIDALLHDLIDFGLVYP